MIVQTCISSSFFKKRSTNLFSTIVICIHLFYSWNFQILANNNMCETNPTPLSLTANEWANGYFVFFNEIHTVCSIFVQPSDSKMNSGNQNTHSWSLLFVALYLLNMELKLDSLFSTKRNKFLQEFINIVYTKETNFHHHEDLNSFTTNDKSHHQLGCFNSLFFCLFFAIKLIEMQ